MDELRRTTSADEAQGRIILAHLGGGASIAAVSNGKCIDTSMGFTPASGLVMGTRTGDLDPGVVRYLTQTEKLNPEQFNHVVNQESGLLGPGICRNY
jgi:acetate kinase